MTLALQDAESKIQSNGFDFMSAEVVADLLGPAAVKGWAEFARSWDHLGEDRFMADGGRYRRRRHAALSMLGETVSRKPHQPHYQSRDYNPLNGGVQRWFDPITEATLANPASQAVFGLCGRLLADLAGRKPWHVEMHQFRIEAAAGQAASPTPEGLHRDGVDWVFVMLVRRENVAEGVTRIAGAGGPDIDRFVLARPMDAVFLDDRRVRHGVTAITPIDPARPAYRDALVVTFAEEQA